MKNEKIDKIKQPKTTATTKAKTTTKGEKGEKRNLLQKIIDKASGKSKKIKDAKSNQLAKQNQPQEPPKPQAPFKLLICISLASNGGKVIQTLESKGIEHSAVIKGYGTAKTSMLSMLGINETERDVVFALVKTETSKGIIKQIVDEFNANDIKNTFCCLISPSSANIEMIKYIMKIGANKND